MVIGVMCTNLAIERGPHSVSTVDPEYVVRLIPSPAESRALVTLVRRQLQYEKIM